MFTRSILAAAMLALTVSPVATAEETAPTERDAIEARIMDYFQGQGTADRERLKRAFAEDVAPMIFPNADGGFQKREIADVIDAWASSENPPGERTNYEILSIEITDDRIATAMFRYTDRFYDAFVLIKQDGEWQIVTKAFVRQ